MTKLNESIKESFECETKAFILFIALYLIGIIAGTFCVRFFSDVTLTEFGNLYKDYVTAGGNVFLNLMHVFIKEAVFLAVIFVLGYTVIGAPIVLLAPIYKGCSLGMVSGISVVLYGFKGMMLTACCFVIQSLIYLFADILVAYSSVRLSFALANVFKKGARYVPASKYTKPHFIKLLVCLIIILGGAIWETMISRLLLNIIL